MIYFDNAATTYPKPGRVLKAMTQGFSQFGANPGRGGYAMSIRTSEEIYRCRKLASQLFRCEPEQVVFTQNCTHALNLAIKGAVREGDHLLISDLEHNSVARPVAALAERGLITYDVVETSWDEEKTIQRFEAAFKPNTAIVICTHASNVTGQLLPIRRLGELSHRYGARMMVDAAQTAGIIDIDMQRDPIDYLCTAGHKGLFGPTGTGLMITPYGEEMATLIEGGSGSFSLDLHPPAIMPDRMESGTVNVIGILGLKAGLSFVLERGTELIYRHEIQLAQFIDRQLRKIPGVTLYAPPPQLGQSVSTLSFNVEGYTGEETAGFLGRNQVAVRGGYHCSYLAHTKLDTQDTGTARISLGAFNKNKEAQVFCRLVEKQAHLQRK